MGRWSSLGLGLALLVLLAPCPFLTLMGTRSAGAGGGRPRQSGLDEDDGGQQRRGLLGDVVSRVEMGQMGTPSTPKGALLPSPLLSSSSGPSSSSSLGGAAAAWQPWALPPHLREHFPDPSSFVLDPSRFRLNIKVLAYSRLNDTLAALESARDAYYLRDEVSLQVLVDHRLAATAQCNMRGKCGEVMREHRQLLKAVDAFHWPHGPKTMLVRRTNANIEGQWIEAWWPETVNDFAYVMESDMRASPLFYIYLKRAVLHYYYNQSNFDEHVYGISFQRQWLVNGKGGEPMQPPPEPFLYPLVGTWGQVLFPIPWKAFRMWHVTYRLSANFDPSVGGLWTTQWWRNLGRNRVWSAWAAFYAQAHQLYNIYTSFPEKGALSVSMRSPGLNHHKSLGADSRLLLPGDVLGSEGQAAQDPAKALEEVARLSMDWSPSLPAWWNVQPERAAMKMFDWCFRPMPSWDTPLRSVEDLLPLLPAFGADKELAVIPVGGGHAAFRHALNWMCHADGLARRNFLFLLELAKDPPKSCRASRDALSLNERVEERARELARRGALVLLTVREGSGRCPGEKGHLLNSSSEVEALSLSQAVAIGQLLQQTQNLRVLVHPPWVLWRSDPFNCLSADSGNVANHFWTFLGRSKNGHQTTTPPQTLVLWADGTPESVSEYRDFTESWKQLQGLRMSSTDTKELKSVQSEALIAHEGIPKCILDGAGGKGALLPSQFGLAPDFWRLFDEYDACRIVVCKK